MTEHFQARQGWINDPNGLVYFEGRYHLFYQHRPDGLTNDGPMHWGHAVSSNLATWEHKPIALSPDELGVCFSGSAVVDRNDTSGLFRGEAGLVAFYTAHREREGFDRGYIQEQCIAYSTDSGETWQKYKRNPVLQNNGNSDFRDPKVFWHEQSEHWILCLATRQTISFYRSKNLLDWEFCSEFGDGQGAHEDHPWECPDLFKLTTKTGESAWILIVGIGSSPDVHFGSYTQYFIGSFDGENFENWNSADTVLMLDEGRDYYATQSWSNVPDQRCLSISWMNNWKYGNDIPAIRTRGQMTIPREFKLVSTENGLRLAQQFAVASAQVGIPDMVTGGRVIELAEPARARFNLNIPEGDTLKLISADEIHLIELTRNESGYQIRVQRCCSTNDAEYKRNFEHDYCRNLPVKVDESIMVEYIYSKFGLELLLADGLMSITQISG